MVIFKLCYNSCLQHKEITIYALMIYAPVAKNMSKRCWSMYHNFWIQISVCVDAILLKRYALLKMGSEFKLANIFHNYSLFKGTRKIIKLIQVEFRIYYTNEKYHFLLQRKKVYIKRLRILSFISVVISCLCKNNEAYAGEKCTIEKPTSN